MQDPSQMTRYGRSMVASAVLPLNCTTARINSSASTSVSSLSSDSTSANTPASSVLHLKDGMVAEDGQGVFQTLGPVRAKTKRPSTKAECYQRRRVQAHLLRLQREASSPTPPPSSPDTKLAAVFTNLLQPKSEAYQPVFALGDWVSTIPSRIGSSRVVTLAAEFFVYSSEVYHNGSRSNKIRALQIKSKALKELQLSVLWAQQHSTYDLLLATKLHYAAEVHMAFRDFDCPSVDMCRFFLVSTTCIMPSTHLA